MFGLTSYISHSNATDKSQDDDYWIAWWLDSKAGSNALIAFVTEASHCCWINEWRLCAIGNVFDVAMFADANDFAGVEFGDLSFIASPPGIRRICFSVFIIEDGEIESLTESFTVFLELDTSLLQSGIQVLPSTTEIIIVDSGSIGKCCMEI